MFAWLHTCFVSQKRSIHKDLSLIEWQMVQWWIITTPRPKETRSCEEAGGSLLQMTKEAGCVKLPSTQI